MPRMSREEEDRLADWFEREAEDPDAWEEDPGPSDTVPRRKLGAQITVRLEPEVVELLSAMAKERRIGHTQLARQLIEEGLSADSSTISSAAQDGATFTIEVKVRPSGDVSPRLV